MKKRSLTGFVFILFILSLSEHLGAEDPSKSCVDSDAAAPDQYLVAGHVNDSSALTYFDFCVNSKILTEYICDDTSTKTFVNFDCSSIGKQCCKTFCCDTIENSDDADADGVSDKGDNCLGVYNPKIETIRTINGQSVPVLIQLDSDSDGVGDACDLCPDLSNSNNDDSDNDGKGDFCDNCPWVPNPDQKDDNKDGVGNVCPYENCSDEESHPFTVSIGTMDHCVNANILKEIWCDDDNALSKMRKFEQNITCPGGCQKNKCLPPQSKPDKDMDGVPDDKDNCPDIKNMYQEDMDNDDIGDVCDPDRDGDKVDNEKDNCPDNQNFDQLDSDNDGKGDECDIPDDFDKDGIKNEDDNCPATPNADQKDSDLDGDGDACEPPHTGNPEGDVKGYGDADCDPAESESHHEESVSTADLYSVAADDVGIKSWVAGEGGNVLEKFANQPWKKIASPWDDFGTKYLPNSARAITSLWFTGAPNNELYATTVGGYVFRYKDKKWSVSLSAKAALYSIHGNKNEIWAVGDNDSIWRYVFADKKWKQMKAPEIVAKNAVPSFKLGYLKQLFLKIMPSSFRHSATKPANAWRGVHVLAGRVVLAGDGGRALQYKNKAWEQLDLNTASELRAVWAEGSFTAIGGENKIWCGSDSSKFSVCWESDASDVAILGMGGSGADNVYAVGTKGLILKRNGGSWQQLPLTSFSNALTSVAIAGAQKQPVITGINGSVYSLDNNSFVPEFIARKELAHPEWTNTSWRAHQGGLKDFWVAGDDLSIAYRDNDRNWKILHSDDSVVPFSVRPVTKKVIKDLYLDEGEDKIYAVGDAEYLLEGSIEDMEGPKITWAKVELAKPSSMVPDIRSVRKGPEESILVAGNLGVFTVTDGAVNKLFKQTLAGGAVADMRDDEIWVATANGTYTLVKNEWLYVPWDKQITPVDIKVVKNRVVVIGNPKKSDGPNFIVPPETPAGLNAPGSYYLASDIDWNDEGTKWWKKIELPKEHTELFSLNPFNEKISAWCINTIRLRGMVTTGDNFLGVRYNQEWYETTGDINENWYDGAYGFKQGYSCPGMWVSSTVETLGVGGHNDIINGKIKIKCSY